MDFRAILISACLLLNMEHVQAQDSGDSGSENVISYSSDFSSSELSGAIREKLEKNADTLGLGSDELGAITEYYKDIDRSTIWISDNEPTEKALAILSELKRANDYGLNYQSFKIPDPELVSIDINSQVTFELKLANAVLIYAKHSRGGRVKPGTVGSQLNRQPNLLEPLEVLKSVADRDDAAAYLQSLHPKHPQFAKLRDLLLKLRGEVSDENKVVVPAGPVLRKGMKHEQVAILRHRLIPDSVTGSPAIQDNLFDKELENSVRKFQRENGLRPDGIVGPGTRKILNGKSRGKLIQKVLINMERWRWLPDNLEQNAGIAVWANVPEFRVRVLKNQDIVFSEKAIVGKISHKTPIFSDRMEWIEIHPVWFIPNSIKLADILPSLKRKTSTVMQRYNLRVHCSGYGSDYRKIDWHSIDISRCSFTQPPGRKSVLGDFKFKFPNKYSVYMHDTHKPGLFSSMTRAYSHGCVRVKQPRKMAEILLAHDKNMSSSELGKILSGPKTPHKETLNRPIPVHITYFTTLFGDNGELVTRPDYYGHDRTLARALGL